MQVYMKGRLLPLVHLSQILLVLWFSTREHRDEVRYPAAWPSMQCGSCSHCVQSDTSMLAYFFT